MCIKFRNFNTDCGLLFIFGVNTKMYVERKRMPNGFSDFDYYSGNFIGLINVEFVSSFTSELVNYISQAIEP